MSEKKIVKLDFTDCKHALEFHERIRVAFDFPEWYGKNWDAFSDLLWSECDANKVEIYGEHTLSKKFDGYINMVHEILEENVAHQAELNEEFEYEVID